MGKILACTVVMCLLAACGDDDGGGGSSGTGDASSGTGGSGGSSGTSGSGGSSGTSGSGGTGGTAGTSGAGGTTDSGVDAGDLDGGDMDSGTLPTCDCPAPQLCVGESQVCECPTGYVVGGTSSELCLDVDECANASVCPTDATCTNQPGTFTCQCASGFVLDEAGCMDVDECSEGSDDCDVNASCDNAPGTYTCECNQGYTGDGTSCADADECAGTNNCDTDPAACANLTGSYACTCPVGFDGDGIGVNGCTDINECLGTTDCSENADCINSRGSYTCTCRNGFTGDGTTCVDRNECTENVDNCDTDPVALCSNTTGSFTCACPTGYTTTDGGVTCTDINECARVGAPVCGSLTCFNTPGSYDCLCPSGTRDVLDDGTSCRAPRDLVALGNGHTCVIQQGGVVKCFGASSYGERGVGTRGGAGHNPDQMANLPVTDLGGRAVQLAAGCNHTCAVLENGDVKCWGRNHLGQLGVGDTDPRGDGRYACQSGSSPSCTCEDNICSTPLPNGQTEMGATLPAVPLGARALSVTAGCEFSCALLEGGGVKCWGGSEYGQLALGNQSTIGDEPNEVGALNTIALGSAVTEVRAGFRFVCARLANNTTKCWGRNQNGQLGLGDQNHRGDQPGEIAALPALDLGTGRSSTSIGPGYIHTCAVLDNGTLKCWGGSLGGHGYGDLMNRGDGPNEMGDALPAVSLVGTPVAVTAQHHTCILFDDHTVSCFGLNGTGQLGLGDTNDRSDGPNEMGAQLPRVDLGTNAHAVAVFTGVDEDESRAHSCALLDSGGLKCWGNNSRGHLGLGDTLTRGDGPNEMGDNLNVAIQLW